MTEVQVFVGDDHPHPEGWRKWDIVQVLPDGASVLGTTPGWGIRDSVEMWDAAVAAGYRDGNGRVYTGPYPGPFAILKCPALDYTKAAAHLTKQSTTDEVERGATIKRRTRRRTWGLLPSQMTQAERLSILGPNWVRSVSLPKFRSWTVDKDTLNTFDEDGADGQGPPT